MMTWDFFFRLLVAGVLGAIIGLDREYRAKEAGFRTHFLVALGSALFMIVSKYGFWESYCGSSGEWYRFFGSGDYYYPEVIRERIDHGCRDMGYFCHWTCSWSRTILAGNQCDVVDFVGVGRFRIYFPKD